MQYKVLIKLFMPETEESYELYIPINLTIYEVSRLIGKLIASQQINISNDKTEIVLYDRRAGTIYNSTALVRDTNIRNGSEVVAIMQNIATTNTAPTEQ